MKMSGDVKGRWSAVALLGALALGAASCKTTQKTTETVIVEEKEGGDGEQMIPVDQVPQAARDAAVAALPGLVCESAEVEVEKGQTVYELKGMAGGKKMEVEVTAEGKVLEVEEDDD